MIYKLIAVNTAIAPTLAQLYAIGDTGKLKKVMNMMTPQPWPLPLPCP